MTLSLVLNEYEWVEHHLETHSLGTSPVRTINKLAKYYYSQNYSKNDIKKMIEVFILQCDPSASPVKWGDKIDKAIKAVDKSPLIHIDGIDIYQEELDAINSCFPKSLARYRIREKRLAFTLLCISKYWDKVSDKNNHWVNISDKEIIKMANIKYTVEKQNLLLNNLKEMGLIEFSKKIDSLNIQVLFSKNSGNEVMKITDFRNLGYQWSKHFGDNFYKCENCGITVKSPNNQSGGRPPKYCKKCSFDIHIAQTVNSVTKNRALAAKNK